MHSMWGKKEKKQDGQVRTCQTCTDIEIRAGTSRSNRGQTFCGPSCHTSMRWFFDGDGHGPSSPNSAKSMAGVSHFLLLLSSLLWRYSPFLVPTVSFLIEPAIRAFVMLASYASNHYLPILHTQSFPYPMKGTCPFGSARRQSFGVTWCPRLVLSDRTIYSASIEKTEWVRPENIMTFTLKSWVWVRNHEK